MYVPFSELSPDARIWIYQSNRAFSAQEVQEISEQTKAFLSQWTAHAKALEAGFTLPYNRFLVIGLNQENATSSGCSIDASVHFVQTLEKAYEIDLLDKMNVSFRQGEYIAYKPLSAFRKMAKERAVSSSTIVFNNLVATKDALETAWEVPAAESWHSRFFKK